MGDIVNRFLNFDKMMGTSIIKVLYYIGIVFIALGVIASMFGALASMGTSFIGGLIGLIMAPVMGVVGLLFWRFMCEIYLLFFKISDDLSVIKLRGEEKAPKSE